MTDRTMKNKKAQLLQADAETNAMLNILREMEIMKLGLHIGHMTWGGRASRVVLIRLRFVACKWEYDWNVL